MKERISSRNNARIQRVLSLSKKDDSFFLVEGYHLVEMAISYGYAKEIYSLEKEYPNADIPQFIITEPVLDKLTKSKTPEGVVAFCEKKEKGPFLENSPLLYLDDVQDPGNVGTLLRSALSFGYHNVFLSKKTADPYSHKALMASQGAIFGLNVHVSKEDDPLLDAQKLREDGYFLLSTDLRNALPLSDIKTLPPSFALILGNEGQGVDPHISQFSDQCVRIEMEGIDSLNVGVAGGILMYNLRKVISHE